MWFEKYEKLSSSLFIAENSGRKIANIAPYHQDFNTGEIKGLYGLERTWKVLGYSLELPFYPQTYQAVGIMFENQHDYEKIWWHYCFE
jgi:hypothetical protein